MQRQTKKINPPIFLFAISASLGFLLCLCLLLLSLSTRGGIWEGGEVDPHRWGLIVLGWGGSLPLPLDPVVSTLNPKP